MRISAEEKTEAVGQLTGVDFVSGSARPCQVQSVRSRVGKRETRRYQKPFDVRTIRADLFQ